MKFVCISKQMFRCPSEKAQTSSTFCSTVDMWQCNETTSLQVEPLFMLPQRLLLANKTRKLLVFIDLKLLKT